MIHNLFIIGLFGDINILLIFSIDLVKFKKKFDHYEYRRLKGNRGSTG
jgi:hypothetical protein